ncbi:MAG: OmpH family outer membrane protein [Verrucomicrobiota bacterium]|nr:OmpH family outer membrane protein [Verrucomicrobiota bacterium]
MIKKLILMVLLVGTAHFAQAQNAKFATVDMNKIFEGYYKKADAEKRLKEQAESYNNERKVYVDGLKKIMDEMNVLRNEAKNQATAEKVQEEKKKAFVMKGAEYEQRMRELQEFDATRRRQLADASDRMRTGIVDDIRKVVNDKSKKEGYTMVFEISGSTANGAPTVLYSMTSMDISDDISKTLNANKPPASATPAPAKKP